MNERIKQLAIQAAGKGFETFATSDFDSQEKIQKFAELIVQECIKQAHSVGDLRGANDDMTFGADTAALKISKHFGVLE